MASKKYPRDIFITACCFFFLFVMSCKSPGSKEADPSVSVKREMKKQQADSFRSGYEMEFRYTVDRQNLMISCIVLSSLSKYDKKTLLTTREPFFEPASIIQSIDWDKPDIDSFVNANKTKVDFWSDTINHAIREYANALDMHDMVFSEIMDDTMDEEMNAIRKKIYQVEDLKKIYQLYFGNDRDLSSLASGEGVALRLQFAYYLYTRPMAERKAILKKIL